MIVTAEQIFAAMPNAFARIPAYLQPLNDSMSAQAINTPKRASMFLAQLAHESMELRYTTELASGAAYEGRMDLGNDHPGDGVRFKGRGLIQITGRANYRRCGEALGVDFLSRPELLATTEYATASAAWFWTDRRLNELADGDRIGACTKTINGGYMGLDQRIGYWLKARKAFGL